MIYISKLDSLRFGITIARAKIDFVEDLFEIEKFSLANNVEMLIARCNTGNLKAVQKMEAEKYRLMDTLIYYKGNLINNPIPDEINKIYIRRIKSGEEKAVAKVGEEAFRDYQGHYHADERLPRKECDEAYVSWAYNSCISKEFADEVLVAEMGKKIVGFQTLRLNNPRESETKLSCVSPDFQKKGIYRELKIHAMHWCLRKGAEWIMMSTQITNTAVQRVWVRLGFMPSHSYYTFHKWFI